MVDVIADEVVVGGGIGVGDFVEDAALVAVGDFESVDGDVVGTIEEESTARI